MRFGPMAYAMTNFVLSPFPLLFLKFTCVIPAGTFYSIVELFFLLAHSGGSGVWSFSPIPGRGRRSLRTTLDRGQIFKCYSQERVDANTPRDSYPCNGGWKGCDWCRVGSL